MIVHFSHPPGRIRCEYQGWVVVRWFSLAALTPPPANFSQASGSQGGENEGRRGCRALPLASFPARKARTPYSGRLKACRFLFLLRKPRHFVELEVENPPEPPLVPGGGREISRWWRWRSHREPPDYARLNVSVQGWALEGSEKRRRLCGGATGHDLTLTSWGWGVNVRGCCPLLAPLQGAPVLNGGYLGDPVVLARCACFTTG